MYPTASAPQYAFGPSLAPVPMLGMARGGLAALANQYRKGGKIKYFEEGGDSATGGADSSPEGGAGAAFGGGSDPGPSSGPGGFGPGGADQSVEGGAGAGFSGPSETQGMAQAEIGNQAVTDALAEAAMTGVLGEQIGAEAQESEAENAANTAAALGAQANAIAAEIANQQQEDAKNAEMAAVMAGQVPGFPGPQAQAAPGFGITARNPLNTNIKEAFGLFSPAVTVTHPLGKTDFSVMDFAAPAMGKGVSAVNSAVNAGRALGFAEGGVASLANQVQNKGRGQDTMLVHMTPGEVKGLQALAMSQGGSLTINPQTGLPEAGFLSRMLPMLAGMALAPLTAGTSLAFLGATPLASALTVGSLTGLATGSLKKGLMAGLGAYGGAGIGQGMSAAAGTAENLAAAAPTTPDPGSFGQIGQSNLATLPTSAPTPPFAAPTIGSPFQTPGVNLGAADLTNLPSSALNTPAPTGLDAFTGGTKAMLQTGAPGEAARSAFMKATPVGSLTAAGTTVASALTPEPAPLPTSKSFIRPFGLNISNPSGTPVYTPQDTREREQVRYTYSPREIYEAAQGGQINSDYNMAVDQNGGFSDAYKEGGLSALAKRRKALAGDKYYKFAQDRKDSSMEAAVDQNFAKGGLGSALPPRFLSGGGDGMSDSIKANIDGKQEARLADGEFVVPADVVSHLGNGSSKAGAKKLYAMMDKIRKARTGRTRQAPEVNARRYMPA